ncbi:MAG: hypothetical protein ACTSPN_10515 [Promethearchaeota archaeon]
MIPPLKDIKDLLLFELLNCQSDDDLNKIYKLFEKIKNGFGDEFYHKQVKLVSHILQEEWIGLACCGIIEWVSQDTINLATEELLGGVSDYWDDRIVYRFVEHVFKPSDFNDLKLKPKKVEEFMKLFNEFLHG